MPVVGSNWGSRSAEQKQNRLGFYGTRWHGSQHAVQSQNNYLCRIVPFRPRFFRLYICHLPLDHRASRRRLTEEHPINTLQCWVFVTVPLDGPIYLKVGERPICV